LVIDVHKRLEGQSSVATTQGNSAATAEGQSQLTTPASSSKFPYPMSALKQTHGWNYHHIDHDLEGRDKGKAASPSDSVTLQQLQVQISGIHFIRDGILMSAAMIWGPLLRYILMETKRRDYGTEAGSNTQIPADDIEKLVTTLQRSENHILAARVVLSTWSGYQGKKQVRAVSYSALFLTSLSLFLSTSVVLLYLHDGLGSQDHCLS
jgi:hypothetical protein